MRMVNASVATGLSQKWAGLSNTKKHLLCVKFIIAVGLTADHFLPAAAAKAVMWSSNIIWLVVL